MDITGASAIVTGGASGLGEATARLLAQRGSKVVVLDLQDDKGEQVAGEIGGVYVKADVADEEQVRAAVEAASELGPLRILVNSAGLGRAGRIIGRDRAACRRNLPGRHPQHRLGGRLRRPDRADAVLGVQGRRGRHDAADGP